METNGWPPPARHRTRLLVMELASEFRPGGIADRAGHVLVADEIGDTKVFRTQPAVSLDELAGDLMQKARRTLLMRACCRDSRRIAFTWLRERRLVRDAALDRRRSLARLPLRGLGA